MKAKEVGYMLNMGPVLFILGILITVLGIAMLGPAFIDFMYVDDDWKVFITSSFITIFIGISLICTFSGNRNPLNIKQAFLLTFLAWTLLAFFASLPFQFSALNLNFTKSMFEAMSGITTTGSTILYNLDSMSKGLLLWRALLQWLGGIGIIVLAIAVLPFLKVGGMQIFRMESSDRYDKILPRTGQIATNIGLIYITLTALCAAIYYIIEMSGFDAITHAFTTLATGGFSTHDTSFGYFKNPMIDWAATLFMLAGSIPFVLYLSFVKGNSKSLYQDDQVRLFIKIVLLFIVFLCIYRSYTSKDSLFVILQSVSFNIVSVITSTGFASADFTMWGQFTLIIFFICMFAGGCSGSTAGGMKIFRLRVLFTHSHTQLRRLMHPRGIFIPHYNGKPISKPVLTSVIQFFFVYIFCFLILSVLLALFGLDFIGSFSCAATSIGNIGPGLKPSLGPAGNFATLPDPSKWVMIFGMLLGRLELFSVLVIFMPSFWRD
jgi:trk/ktr system potassium uptake protein